MLQLQEIGQDIFLVLSTTPNGPGVSAVGTIELRAGGYRAYSSRAPGVSLDEVGQHPTKERALEAFSGWWDDQDVASS